MSVKLMSAVFETEFTDLKDEAGNVTKASTAKLVLLAMADHANDEGEGAYPSIERLRKKTALSEQTIRNRFDALRHNDIIFLTGKSKYGTNNHTINTKSFPKAIGKEVTYLTLHPLDSPTSGVIGSNQSPQGGNSLDPNHPLTTNKPSREIDSAGVQKVWTELEKLCGAVALDTARLIDVWIEKHALERILKAIGVARDRGARSPKYVDQVLITWEANGYPPTREQQVLARAFKPSTNKAADRASSALSALINYGKVLEANGE